jgi:hydrogenase nickel incorporation protein HypA/HybF
MHEFTITSSIVEAVLDLARKQGSRKVQEVHLTIGKLRVLSIDQVKFCYDVLAKGTLLEDSKLIVEVTPGNLRCPQCNYTAEFNPENDPLFHFGVPPLVCPQCGNALTIEGGDELVITRVRMLLPSVTHESEVSQ